MTKAELRVARMKGDLMLPEVNDSEQNGPLAKQSAKKQVLLRVSSGTTIHVSAYYHICGRIQLRDCYVCVLILHLGRPQHIAAFSSV